ncbi:MAG: hypothetical protein LBR22_11115 [Desulfovibrio sp.]|jgi:hypothetical protein|nr:hypothetical protein [Desulfovibrio sp.]
MRIQSDPLNALQTEQSSQSDKSSSAASAFAELLNETLAAKEDKASAGPVAPPPAPPTSGLISQMLLGVDEATQSTEVEVTQSTEAEEDLLQEAFAQASGALDMWDTYAQSLKTPGGTLRDSYALLEDIDSTVSGLRQDTAALREQSPAMDSLLNELEIMTLTEKIKFNRGDYLV